jgi:2-amino-4-hydroxy-6-hydroxymethyldihydropteridine diphosphokinase
VLARSSVYETEPVGEVLDQPDFYNAVVAVETNLSPHELLAACKGIERDLGRREGGARHAPRPIDLDLLIMEDVALAEEGLVIPHPELANRRFVLAPLEELALAAIGDSQRVVRVTSLA